MRRLAMFGAVICVLIVAGVIALYFSLNSIIRSAVETYGPQATKSEVRLGGVNVSPLSGNAQLSDLFVGNPKGFKTPSAFKLGGIHVALEVSSLMSDKVVIYDIIITSPEITYELGPGGSNLKALQKNVEEFTGGGGGKDAGAGQPKGDGKKVTIDRLRVQNAKLIVRAGDQVTTVELSDIEIRDIGKGGQGTPFALVVERVLREVNRKAGRAAANVDWKGEAEKALKKETEGSSGGIGEKLKGIFGK